MFFFHQPKNVFNHIDDLIGDKIPKILVKILRSSGYTTKGLLAELTEENVRKLELYVQKHRDILIGSEYQEIADFAFLPGHRAFLLSLPEKVKQIIQTERNEGVTIHTTAASASHEEKSDEIQELKTKLLVKLLKFAEKNKFALSLSTESVVDLFRDRDQFKCKIVCPHCNKQISCIYKTYWLVSNAQNHLRACFSLESQAAHTSNQLKTNISSTHDPLADPNSIYVNSQQSLYEEYIIEDSEEDNIQENFAQENQLEIKSLIDRACF